MTASTAVDWSADVFREIKARDIKTVCTVPDGGLTRLLNMVEADAGMRLVTLSTEEEGIGVATGQWLGGTRAMPDADHHARPVGRVQSVAGAHGAGCAPGARGCRREVFPRG